MIAKLKRTPGIYLVGFMGCGKFTIGRMLAENLGWPFEDLDEEIERERHETISEIFEKRGEPEFRRIEAEAVRNRVRRVEAGRPLVLALGGGAFTRQENIELLKENGITIWLDCPLDVLQARVARTTHRPLARDVAKFEELLAARRSAYEQAEFRVEVGNAAPWTHVARILKLPIF